MQTNTFRSNVPEYGIRVPWALRVRPPNSVVLMILLRSIAIQKQHTDASQLLPSIMIVVLINTVVSLGCSCDTTLFDDFKTCS